MNHKLMVLLFSSTAAGMIGLSVHLLMNNHGVGSLALAAGIFGFCLLLDIVSNP